MILIDSLACLLKGCTVLQSKVRKEAALSAVDEQRRNKEATEAENAANIAKMAEHEAAVCAFLLISQ